MVDVQAKLDTALADAGPAREWLTAAIADLEAGRAKLAVLFPQLPRRVGRDAVGGSRQRLGAGEVDLDAWRRCDLAALALLTAGDGTPPDDATLFDLFAHGDMEERTMVSRALAALPIGKTTARLLGEAQRTNTGVHFEACGLDSDLLMRTLAAHGDAQDEFGPPEWNAFLLKIAFLDLPVDRVFGWETGANAELSRMLTDLATEREAATRKVWHDTNRVLAHAPIDGTVARILGGLEHGDDAHRRASAEAVRTLQRPELAAYARERAPREPRPEIRGLLESPTRA